MSKIIVIGSQKGGVEKTKDLAQIMIRLVNILVSVCLPLLQKLMVREQRNGAG